MFPRCGIDMTIMDHTGHRQTPRLPLRIPVRCESAAVPGYRTLGLTHNVSRGGLMIEAPRVVDRGITTTLRLLTGDQITSAEAVVVWTAEKSPGRMGLRLTKMTAADCLAWEALLAFQGGPTPRASLRIPIDLEITCLVPPDTTLTGRTENLSEGGLLVVLPWAIPPQKQVRVTGPEWLILPQVEAEVIWTRVGPERNGVLHGLRVLSDDVGKELFIIGSILRMLLG